MDSQERDFGQTLGGKVFRRKKRYQGATWTPPTQSAASGDGVWCPACRMRHGYSQLGFAVGEKRGDGKYKLLWSCKKTGDVLEEM